VKSHLLQLLLPVAQSIYPEILANSIQLDRPKSIEHGDFSSNLAMALAKSLKKNPRELATLIIEKLPASPLIEKVEIAGAGFINFYLSDKARTFIIHEILKSPDNFGQNTSGHNEKGVSQKVQIEFVSANPTGPLHVGHGRGAAIGDSLARLLKFNGWDVTREFYYNDAGAQIDNLTKSVHARCHNMDPSDPAFPEDGYRGEYIVEIANAFLNKSSIECEGKTIHASGLIDDLESIRQFSVAYLRHEQDQDLNAFQIKFDVFTLESSFYQNGHIEKVVASLIKNGFTYEEDNALWLKTTEFGDDKNRVMKKSDGSYTYFIPDVAYHFNKWERGFKRVINEQGSDHHSTITRVRAGLQALKAGIPETYPEYVLHQMITVMKGGEEVKLSKRAGNYVTLRDLIDEVGCDATRYFLVARKPDSQLVFDIDLAKTQNSDNPVYYIQYAHARIASLLAKSDATESAISNAAWIFNHVAERALVLAILAFPATIKNAADLGSPQRVCSALHELANSYATFYQACPVLKAPDEATRLARLRLSQLTKRVLAQGLHLLGMDAPNRM
jgi:arginyl-tRNA synthetase